MTVSNPIAAHIVHLSKDKKLKPLLSTVEPYQLQPKQNVCLRLCASIISQQLSTKVADVIFGRFLSLLDNENPTPTKIASLSIEQLRSVGLSNAKANYVLNVAKHFIENNATDDMLFGKSNEEVLDFLLPIKGVGRWTVEMLLMFTLAREDVFAPDDLGIQQAMANLYKLDLTDKKALRSKMLLISEKWSPYRTHACFYLWRFKDAK